MSPQQHQQQHDSPSPNGLHSRQDSIESDKASTSPAPPVEAKQEKVTTTASREAENPTDQIEQDEAQAAAFSKDAPPPDKGYAWVIAACVFGQNTVTWGMATSKFLSKHRTESDSGASYHLLILVFTPSLWLLQRSVSFSAFFLTATTTLAQGDWSMHSSEVCKSVSL